MAGIDFTTTGLIASVRRRGMAPTSQLLFTDQELADILSEELHADIVPLLMKEQEDFLAVDYDQAIDTSVNVYYLPPRAVGGKLKDVVLVDSVGREINFPRLSDPQSKQAPLVINASTQGWVFEMDRVKILPNAQGLGSYTLRMKHYRRPNNLVKVATAGQITAINTGTMEVTLANAPSAWSVSTLFDVIQGTPFFRAWGEDQVITNKSGSVLTFASLPAGMAVGDWVAEQGFSPIPQIPYEVFNILAQRAVIKVLEDMGDREGMNAAIKVYEDMADKFRGLVSPRSDGTPQKLVSGGGIGAFVRGNSRRFY
jgi:plasmid stabilization system protein ParE